MNKKNGKNSQCLWEVDESQDIPRRSGKAVETAVPRGFTVCNPGANSAGHCVWWTEGQEDRSGEDGAIMEDAEEDRGWRDAKSPLRETID